jgi:hypothetical protein
VLFIVNKHMNVTHQLGASLYDSLLMQSFVSTRTLNYARINYDECWQENGIHVDDAVDDFLASYASSTKLIVFVEPVGEEMQPTARAFDRAEHIPTVLIHSDALFNVFPGHSTLERFDPVVDLHVSLDSPYLVQGKYTDRTIDHDKWMWLWTPLDPTVFYDTGRTRTVDVAFVGTLNPHRQEVIRGLFDAGIDVKCSGGLRTQTGEYLSPQDYAARLQEAKICLNFPYVDIAPPTSHTNGRIFEVMHTGGCLLQHWFAEFNLLMTPGEHYAAYDNMATLVETIRWLLDDEGERRRIAGNGYSLANSQFSAKRFWAELYSQAGVSL